VGVLGTTLQLLPVELAEQQYRNAAMANGAKRLVNYDDADVRVRLPSSTIIVNPLLQPTLLQLPKQFVRRILCTDRQ
jgi:hypothetical protein